MNFHLNHLLWRYEHADWLLQRKARTLLILSVVIFIVLISEIVLSSLILGRLAPESFANLSLAIGFALVLIPLLRGSYNLSAASGMFVALAGISWTRYVSTGYFSSDASYDFIQYVVDLIVVLFYANLAAQRKRHIVVAIGCSLFLLSIYAIALPTMFQSILLPATKSVFISGYIFLILSGLLVFFTFQQNQKAIEKARQESEASSRSKERLSSFINSASDSFYLLDADLNFVEINKRGLEIIGKKKEEVIGKNIADIVPDVKYSGRYEKHLDVIATGRPFVIENFIPHPIFGDMHFVLTSFKVGNGLGVIAHDITERKRAEKALQESEELYRKLITTVPDLIVRTDLEGNIVFVNDTDLESFGYSKREDIFGKNILSFIGENDRERAIKNMKRMFDQYLGPREYTLVGKEGLQIDCEVSGDILRHNDGTPFGMVLFIRDLTEKKKMQTQLIQSQKMEAIGRLAGGIAHDYNNMLGVILGYTSMIEKELPSLHPAQSKIKSIISAAERSANLTKQLLAFARQQIIAPVVVNLNDELTSLQKMLGRLIGEDIKLVFNQEEKLWNTMIDPTQLTQVITNLATNARDAIENVGTITIRTENIFIDKTMASEQSEISPGEFVMLSFSDSGIGMDKKVLNHIFEPFFTTKSNSKGTGLGLATVFGIVKQNNGFITVSSEVGHGTSVKVYLPRFIGESNPIDESEEKISLDGEETILIVEDEEQLLFLAKLTLERQGYKVLSALSPSEALALTENSTDPIDLLITDVVMPGMNGKELKVWMEKKYQNIKTLFISGYTSDIVAKRGVLEEGVHFLQKPFTLIALLKKVKEVLHGQVENT